VNEFIASKLGAYLIGSVKKAMFDAILNGCQPADELFLDDRAKYLRYIRFIFDFIFAFVQRCDLLPSLLEQRLSVLCISA
jgi:hypothetical protein